MHSMANMYSHFSFDHLHTIFFSSYFYVSKLISLCYFLNVNGFHLLHHFDWICLTVFEYFWRAYCQLRVLNSLSLYPSIRKTCTSENHFHYKLTLLSSLSNLKIPALSPFESNAWAFPITGLCSWCEHFLACLESVWKDSKMDWIALK